jgi:hypothetical protein
MLNAPQCPSPTHPLRSLDLDRALIQRRDAAMSRTVKSNKANAVAVLRHDIGRRSVASVLSG